MNVAAVSECPWERAGRKPGRLAGADDSALSAAAARLRSASGLFLAGGCAAVGPPARGGLAGAGRAALLPGSLADAWRSRATTATILSPWAPVSPGCRRARAAPRAVGLEGAAVVWAAGGGAAQSTSRIVRGVGVRVEGSGVRRARRPGAPRGAPQACGLTATLFQGRERR